MIKSNVYSTHDYTNDLKIFQSDSKNLHRNTKNLLILKYTCFQMRGFHINSETRYVLYRYPNQEQSLFVEGVGSDSFVYSYFIDEAAIRLEGAIHSYSKATKFPKLVSKRSEQHIISDFESYAQQFEAYQAAFAEGTIHKAILSRIIEQPYELEDIHVLFDNLCTSYPTAFVYIAQLQNDGIWIGASPERLLKYKNNQVWTTAIAGTQLTDDPSAWSKKEYEEQGAVVEFIEGLASSDYVLTNKTEPYLYSAGHLFHLRSDFEFEMAHENIPEFLKSLHPTPAVCGLPQSRSRALINDVELHQRRLYTGYLGALSASEEAQELYVNLRCMEYQGNKAYIYVGGGINSGSQVDKEWQETENKAKIMTRIMS